MENDLQNAVKMAESNILALFRFNCSEEDRKDIISSEINNVLRIQKMLLEEEYLIP